MRSPALFVTKGMLFIFCKNHFSCCVESNLQKASSSSRVPIRIFLRFVKTRLDRMWTKADGLEHILEEGWAGCTEAFEMKDVNRNTFFKKSHLDFGIWARMLLELFTERQKNKGRRSWFGWANWVHSHFEMSGKHPSEDFMPASWVEIYRNKTIVGT